MSTVAAVINAFEGAPLPDHAPLKKGRGAGL